MNAALSSKISSAGARNNTEHEPNAAVIRIGSTKFCHETLSKRFLSLEQARAVTNSLHNHYSLFNGDLSNITKNSALKFGKVGKALYEKAMKEDSLLFTIQIGGMDGQSNDPMFNTLVKGKTWKLDHWIPMVFEPVQTNFINLRKTYRHLEEQRDLSCSYLLQYAVSYNAISSTCGFCRFEPLRCPGYPDWMKYQLGSLDCAYSRKKFQVFDKCWIEEAVNCGSLASVLENAIGTTNLPIAILQVDVEGYEAILIQEILSELPSLPALINFERKVMDDPDLLQNTSRTDTLYRVLRKNGYILHPHGEDIMALHLPSAILKRK